MLELILSRTLVKPLFSLLLGIGATIGVACLLMVLSLFQNYYLSTEKVFMGIHPHIEIYKEDMQLTESEAIVRQLQQTYPVIDMIAPAIYKKVKVELAEVEVKKASCVLKAGKSPALCRNLVDKILSEDTVVSREGFNIFKRETKEVFLKGISVYDNRTVMQLTKIITGVINFNRLKQNTNANNYPIPWGFFMEMPPKSVLEDYLLNVPQVGSQQHLFRLIGALEMGRKKGQEPLLIMSLENAQTVLNLPGRANTIEIRIKEPYQSDQVAKQLQETLGHQFTVHNWTEREQASFTFLRMTKIMAFAILFSISIVAAISVYSTLLLAVMQNQKKISILKALGIKNRNIYLVFITHALTIGVMGIIAGSLLGYVGSEWLVAHFADSLQKVGLDNPHTEITLIDLLLTTGITLLLFLLTAIIPAYKAVTIDPVENL